MEKQLGKYIAPNILAMVGISCYVLADTFFISLAEGADGITALNLVIPIYAIIYALGSMAGVGSATRYALAKSVGGEDTDEYFSGSIWFTLAMSAVFVLCGIFCPEQLLFLLGADEGIAATGLAYTRIVLCFAPCFMLNYTFTAFVRNDSAPGVAMAATLISGVFNIAFDYIFMFPLGMGMAGAALATGISPMVSMGICLFHYLSRKNTVVFSRRRPSLRRFVSACALGMASFVGELSGGITTLVFNFILLGLGGNTAVAAYGVVANIALVGTALFNGVSTGLQPVASLAHGRGEREAERKIYRRSLSIALGIAVVIVAGALLFADTLVALFNSEGSAELAESAVTGMRLYFPGFLLAAVNIVKSGFCGAVDRGLESSVTALSRGIVCITLLAFLLSRALGMTGVWLSFPAAEAATWLVSALVTRCVQRRPQA